MSQFDRIQVHPNTYITPGASLPPLRAPLWVRITVLIFLGVALLILAVLSAARLQPLHQPVVVPPSYLPGSPIPADLICPPYSGQYAPRCAVELQGYYLYVHYSADGQTILRVVDPTLGFTLGDLIAAWGSPTSLNWNGYSLISVFWGTQSALLRADAPQPTSPVSFILYEAGQHGESPWRGFQRAMP